DSDSMLVKAQLVAKIGEIVEQRALTQDQTAKILGLTQPKVSALLKGRFRGISEHRLMECLTRLGRDVHIVIKPTPKSRSNGRLTSPGARADAQAGPSSGLTRRSVHSSDLSQIGFVRVRRSFLKQRFDYGATPRICSI